MKARGLDVEVRELDLEARELGHCLRINTYISERRSNIERCLNIVSRLLRPISKCTRIRLKQTKRLCKLKVNKSDKVQRE